MTFKFALKAGCAAVTIVAASAANAGLFYLDIGTSYGPTGGQVNSTSTSVKNEIQYKYDSSTFIADTNLDGVISAGDALTTTAGLAVNGITIANLLAGANSVNNFIPSQSFVNNSNNGYGANWLIGTSVTGLTGVVTGVNGGVPTFAYAPGGVVELYLSVDGLHLINFMDILLTGGGATGVSTILTGTVDFTNVDASYNNLFHTAVAPSGCSYTGFYDIWKNCNTVTDPFEIVFSSTQDTNVLASSFVPVAGGFAVSTNHNGSATFSVPEPDSLALIGLALAGLAMTQRRRKQVK